MTTPTITPHKETLPLVTKDPIRGSRTAENLATLATKVLATTYGTFPR